jgi:hypothetical protein
MPDPIKVPVAKSFGSSFLANFKGFFAGLWAFIKRVSPKLLGPLAALVVIAVTILLVSMGFKELQIGGLLGKLLGKKGGVDPGKGPTVEAANTIDPKRVDTDGKLIPQGTPDAKGDTQAVVVPIQPPGIFSDPNQVVFTAPGDIKPTVIDLPEGVTSKQVDQVIFVKPEVYAVTVKDNSGIPTQTIDNLLSKYRK